MVPIWCDWETEADMIHLLMSILKLMVKKSFCRIEVMVNGAA
ncbi:hypothetical protein [Holophaga foetida]|nr:hypothetical protein [Holophaga foetida]